jgi:hypothetical protein
MLLRESESLNQSRIRDGRWRAKAGKKGRQSIALEKRLLNSSGSDATGVPPREPSGAPPSVSGERFSSTNHVLPISLPLLEMDFAQSFSAVQYREASRS